MIALIGIFMVGAVLAYAINEYLNVVAQERKVVTDFIEKIASILSTHRVKVTSQEYTLSFAGVGHVILSGAHNEIIKSASAASSRSSFTFTPKEGTLTITTLGGCSAVQLDKGNKAQPYAAPKKGIK